MDLIEKWFPRKPATDLAERLSAFYKDRHDYHEMTASAAKLADPQVKLLECLVSSGGRYLEVGCGSGTVTRKMSRIAHVMGIDGSHIAIEKAQSSAMPGEACEFAVASAYRLPMSESSLDGVFSCEVLEHLLDPVAAVKEMVRVLKPGGFLLLSAPNRFSMDLHLSKNLKARLSDKAAALLRHIVDAMRDSPCAIFEPDLDGDVYPDCDAVSCLIPHAFCREVESMGMKTIFWDSGYMCAHRAEAATDLAFQRRCSEGSGRRWGDHFLMLFRKK